MAVVVQGEGANLYKITKWLGLNENPDGDTAVKSGEAARMENFRITRDWSLQLRPGYQVIVQKRWSGSVRGVWSGRLGSSDKTVFACGGELYEFDADTGETELIPRGSVDITDTETHFFGFEGKLYIQNGHEYLSWDGEGEITRVEGYRPLVVVASPPAGGGTELERVNKLNGARRIWISPTGSATMFQLPEKDIVSIDYIKNRATGEEITAFLSNLEDGTVTFTTVPAAGTSSIEIGYTHGVTMRAEVEAMQFSEIFNGSADNRVFLYGDGSSRTIYSGLDYDGAARADYFPDLNVLNIGSSNTPITALIRHYSRLAVFKSDSAYSVAYGAITLEDGRTTAAFYYTPSNRSVGNIAPGEALLVENSPRTLADGAVIEWRNHSAYAANLTSDERQAKIISQRVSATLSKMDFANARTFFDRHEQEYYVLGDGIAVVNGVATDTWYIYRDFRMQRMFEVDGELYGFTTDGDLVHISRRYQNDAGRKICAEWRSGAMSLGRDWRLKYAARIFVTLKPEVRSYLRVGVRTNHSAGGDVVTSSNITSFEDVSFEHWSFSTNRQPQTKTFKIRAKKFAYYQLVLQSDTDWSTATILTADIKFRFAGEVR